jgi:hypothetical protein
MALIKCPECGKEISDQAIKCPKCGCPINETHVNFNDKAFDDFWNDTEEEPRHKKRFNPLIIVIIILVAIIAVGAFFFIKFYYSSNSPTEQEETKTTSEPVEQIDEEEEKPTEEYEVEEEPTEEEKEQIAMEYVHNYIKGDMSVNMDSNYFWYVDKFVIENQGSKDIEFIECTLKMVDSNNNVLATQTINPINNIAGEVLKANDTYSLNNTDYFSIGNIDGTPTNVDWRITAIQFEGEELLHLAF